MEAVLDTVVRKHLFEEVIFELKLNGVEERPRQELWEGISEQAADRSQGSLEHRVAKELEGE